MSGDKLRAFDVVRGDEVIRLDSTDLDQLDDLAGDTEGTALWWGLRRLEWEEADRAREV